MPLFQAKSIVIEDDGMRYKRLPVSLWQQSLLENKLYAYL